VGLLHFDVLLYDSNPLTHTRHFYPRFFFIDMCTYTSRHSHKPHTLTDTHQYTLSHRHRHWHTHIYDGDHIQKNLHTNDHLTIFAISKKFPPGMCQSEVAELLLTKHLYYIDNISYIFYTILYGKLYINIYKKNEENQKQIIHN